MGAAGQPGGQGREHLLQGQLAGRWRWLAQQVGGSLGAMADRDVGQLVRSQAPGQADAHQFGPEWVEIGGFGVEGHRAGGIAAAHQLLHQGLQFGSLGDDPRLQLRQALAAAGWTGRLRGHAGGAWLLAKAASDCLWGRCAARRCRGGRWIGAQVGRA